MKRYLVSLLLTFTMLFSFGSPIAAAESGGGEWLSPQGGALAARVDTRLTTGGALLVDAPSLTVNGVAVTEANQDDVLGEADGSGATVKYDPTTNTLTLNGAHIVGESSAGDAVILAQSSDPLHIVLVGENTLTSTENIVGIWSDSSALVISGPGTLTVETSGSALCGYRGVTVSSGTLNLTSQSSNGIYSPEGITISGTADIAANGYYAAIHSDQNVSITSGKVNAVSNHTGNDTSSSGLYATESIAISNAQVTAVSHDDCGIFTPGNLAITNEATVTATGYYAALRGNAGITIADSKVEATSSADCGIFSPANIAITSQSEVTAKGYWAALRSNGGMTISGGKVYATSTNDAGIYSGTLAIKESAEVTAMAAVGLSNPPSALCAENEITIDNATATITAADGTGIYAKNGDVTITNQSQVNITAPKCIAAYGDGNLLVQGEGTILTADASAAVVTQDNQPIALDAGGDITITDHAKVSVTSPAYGFYPSGDVIISGGAMVEATSQDWCAIQAVNAIKISGAGTEVIARSQSAAYSAMTAVYGQIALADGAHVVVDNPNGVGLYGNEGAGAIAISGQGTLVEVTGGSETTAAVFSHKPITVTAHAVLKTSSQVGGGVYSQAQVTISDSVVTADVPADKWGVGTGLDDTTMTFENAWLDSSGGVGGASGAVDSVVISGTTGQVYGNAVLPADTTLRDGTTLSVSDGGSLTIPADVDFTLSGIVALASGSSLINNGQVTVSGGTLNAAAEEGLLQGSGAYQVTNGGEILLPTGQTAFCTVTYQSKGSVLNVVLYPANSTIALPDAPTLAGFRFQGWHDGQRLYQPKETFTVTQNTIFTAQWESLVPPYSHSYVWRYDADEHWQACTGCTSVINQGPHQFSSDVCQDCSYKRPGDPGGESGSGGGDYTLYYTLTFATNGGTRLETLTYAADTIVDLSRYAPQRDGYTFTGWYSDAALIKAVQQIRLRDNRTVYAGWEKVELEEATPAEELPFDDVQPNDWYYDEVCFVYREGLMSGLGETTFAPQASATRAMLAAILHRAEGSPLVSGSLTFGDMTTPSWYDTAVLWSVQQQIFNGYPDGTFAPNGFITREQLAAVLYNYAQGQNAKIAAGDQLAAFTDGAAVAPWAKDAMHWAVAEGILKGRGNDQLQPQSPATRAEIATILHRFLIR